MSKTVNYYVTGDLSTNTVIFSDSTGVHLVKQDIDENGEIVFIHKELEHDV